MATGFTLPPPPLERHDSNVAEKWKKFRLAWDNYSLASELNKKKEDVQVATLLTIIGEDAKDVYSTFTNWPDDDSKKENRTGATEIRGLLSATQKCSV